MCKYNPECSTRTHEFGDITELSSKTTCINCGQEKRRWLYLVLCNGERQEGDVLWHVFQIITPIIHCPKCHAVQVELMFPCPTSVG